MHRRIAYPVEKSEGYKDPSTNAMEKFQPGLLVQMYPGLTKIVSLKKIEKVVFQNTTKNRRLDPESMFGSFY